MGKLEPIDGKQTKWEGLWWHPEYNGYSSGVLDLSDIRKFKGKVRLYVRKNKYFNNGENGRPNYCFSLKDANSEVFNCVEIEESDSLIDRLRDVMRQGKANADHMALPSESVATAKALMDEAIRIIEEMTGVEWNFTALTWG